MTQDPRSDRKASGPLSREQRLKAALKANMGRRKAQARARQEIGAEDGTENRDQTPGGTTAADNDLE